MADAQALVVGVAWLMPFDFPEFSELPQRDHLSLVNSVQACVCNKEADFSCASNRCMESVPSVVAVQTHVSCAMRRTERSTQPMQRVCQSVSDMWSVSRGAAWGRHPTPVLGTVDGQYYAPLC